MKAGNIVRFDFDDKDVAYGTIVFIDNDNASVDYKSPLTREFEVKLIPLKQLTLVGSNNQKSRQLPFDLTPIVEI